MKIAVITGASSGMGMEFVRQLERQHKLDEIWVIARREERLAALREELRTPLRVLALDLTRQESFDRYAAVLNKVGPQVEVLVNASGYGKFGRYDQIPLSDTMGMIDLNCKALAAMTELTLPYMSTGSCVYQIDSLSSFQPVPYLNAYGASKAFVLSYSRGLNAELKGRGIRVMAVCPGWVRTEFFDRAMQTSRQAVTYFNRMYEAKDVVRTALRDMRRGKDVSIHGLRIKGQVLLVKLLPHRLVMHIWLKQQKHT